MSLMGKLLGGVGGSLVAGGAVEGTKMMQEAKAENKATLNNLLQSMGEKFNTFSANKAAASKELTRLADASSALKGLDPDMFGTYSNKQMTDLVRNLESIGGEGKAIATYLASKQDSTYSLVPQVLEDTSDTSDTSDDSDAVTQTGAVLAKSSLAPVGDRTGIEEAFKGKSYGKLQREALAQLGISEAEYNAMVANQGALDSGPRTATFKFTLNDTKDPLYSTLLSHDKDTLSRLLNPKGNEENIIVGYESTGTPGGQPVITPVTIPYTEASKTYIAGMQTLKMEQESPGSSGKSEEELKNLKIRLLGLQRGLMVPNLEAAGPDIQNILSIFNPMEKKILDAAVNESTSPILRAFLNETHLQIINSKFDLLNSIEDNGVRNPENNDKLETLRTLITNASEMFLPENRIVSPLELHNNLKSRINNLVNRVNANPSVFTMEERINIAKLEQQYEVALALPENTKEEISRKTVQLFKLEEIVALNYGKATEIKEAEDIDDWTKRAQLIVKDMIASEQLDASQEEDAITQIAARLAAGWGLRTVDTDKGPKTFITKLIKNDATKRLELIEEAISTFLPSGEQVILTGKVAIDNKEAIETALRGIQTTGDLTKLVTKHPAAFNTVFTAVHKSLTDISDMVNVLSGNPEGGLFSKVNVFGLSSKEYGDVVQDAQGSATTLLAQAKDVLFDDPRLSDRDLQIVKYFIAVLNEGVNTIGITRATTAMSVIRQALAATWLMRTADATDLSVTPANTHGFEYELSQESLIKLKEEKGYEFAANYQIAHNLNKRLKTDMSKDSLKSRLAKNLMQAVGLDILSAKEAKNLTPEEEELREAKLQMVERELEYAYSNYTINDRDGKKMYSEQYLSPLLANFYNSKQFKEFDVEEFDRKNNL